MEPVNITIAEKEMLNSISEVIGLSQIEFDVLYYAYRYTIAQGVAAQKDIMEMMSLGIPLYQTLAGEKSVTVDDIDRMLLAGSITSEDIQNAFIKMTSEGGLFYRPIKS